MNKTFHTLRNKLSASAQTKANEKTNKMLKEMPNERSNKVRVGGLKKIKHHITKGSVFDDLGFDEAEATNLKIRASLMRAIEEEIDKKNLTQQQAAKILAVTQPRISDLRRGKIHLFTIDVLVNILTKLGKPVSLVIDDRIAA